MIEPALRRLACPCGQISVELEDADFEAGASSLDASLSVHGDAKQVLQHRRLVTGSLSLGGSWVAPEHPNRFPLI